MSVNEQIMEMCMVLAEQENLRVTINESLKGGVMTGSGAVVGGLLGGPIGIAIGGSFAAIMSALFAKKFKSVVYILRNDLTPAQKRKLTNNMTNVLSSIQPQDYVQLVAIVLTSASLKEVVIKELSTFLLKEMNLTLMQ